MKIVLTPKRVGKAFLYYSLFCSFIAITYAQEQLEEVSPVEKKKINVKLGGVLRYNYNYSSWKPNQRKRGGDFGFEVFRINVDATYDKWEFHVDQRFYSEPFGGLFLKYGWIQYNLSDQTHVKLGLIPAYFGVQQFNSHSWFFQLPFYLGFEDDHDMGVSYDFENEKFKVDIGFYKNSERLTFSDNAPISDDRYNYDFSGRNQEINQFNLRCNYKFGNTVKHQFGSSLQYGGIWNIDTKEIGSHLAIGIQYEMDYEGLNLKAQYLNYNNNPINADGENRDVIEMTAYGAPYNTAAQASIYSIGISYTFNINKGPLNSIQVYNDYAYMDKAVNTWEDTQMNILGVLWDLNPVYIYTDLGMGKHQPWLGPQWTDALTTGDPNNSWEYRFNINFGYYY